MAKRVAILQSNYIPWKGYFDLINLVDEFILFDDVQFTKRDWRNRNLIKTPIGPQWLTIPVIVKGKYSQKIKDTQISDLKWAQLHWHTIAHNYARAPHFKRYCDLFENLYQDVVGENILSKINFRFLTAICDILGITTRLTWSMDYIIKEGKTERLVSLCEQAEASEYFSGPAAKAYIDESLFREKGIELHYMDYSGYPEYFQLYPPFDHRVSVLDLIFNEGPDAPKYLLSFQK